MNNTLSAKILLACLFAAPTLFIAGCGDEEKEKTYPPRHVKSMTITGSGASYEQSFSGRLHSTSEVSFSFKVPGTIESLLVKKGDKVREGDVLARLESSDYELEVEKTQAALAESEATHRNAKANYERVKQLYVSGSASRKELDNARAESDTAAAGVQADRKALEIARKELSYTYLKADSNCAIADVSPDVGENVDSGEQIVYSTCGDELEVKLNIPESVISHIKKYAGHRSLLSD